MLRWAVYLADAPVALHRLIAAYQRVRLPHRADNATRLACLRAALCRPAAARTRYAALAPTTQQALQMLRRRRGVLSPSEVERLLGPIRSLRQLGADRQPCSIAEELVLLGWLLPRPARPRHPAGWVLAPELRSWLPTPLPSSAGVSAAASSPPALMAAYVALLAAAECPLIARRDATPTAATIRRLARLAPQFDDALWPWLLPLLVVLRALQPVGRQLVPGPAASRLTRAPLTERISLLRAAWERAPAVDRWLVRLRVTLRGLDLPAFRRRLLYWGEAAAQQGGQVDLTMLTAAFGPLVDATTHALAPFSRAPWTRQSQRRVWQAAAQGPLRWLGVIDGNAATAGSAWSYDAAAQTVKVPATAIDADIETLAQWSRLDHADSAALYLRITPASIRRAMADGHQIEALQAIWQGRLALPVPAELPAPMPPVRLAPRMVAIWEHPAADRALAGCRSGMFALVAPGMAIVTPGCERALTTMLSRTGVPVTVDAAGSGCSAPSASATPLPPAEWQSSERPCSTADLVTLPFSTLRQRLTMAIRRRQAVLIGYHPPHRDAEQRPIQPLRLERHGDRWLLIAFCALRRAERCFRLDRITGIAPLPSPRRVSKRQSLPRQPAPRNGFFAPPPSALATPHLARVWLEETELTADFPSAARGSCAPAGERSAADGATEARSR